MLEGCFIVCKSFDMDEEVGFYSTLVRIVDEKITCNNLEQPENIWEFSAANPDIPVIMLDVDEELSCANVLLSYISNGNQRQELLSAN